MRVLMSVDDKSRLVEFARALHEAGWELIASGGTSKALSDAGLPVTTVESFTGSPEILGGRVKTLHPAIHGGILARDSEQDARDLERIHSAPIDMVVSNLYPFEATIAKPGVTEEEAIEKIDIGGVALTRAAAKNSTRVTILCDPADYDSVAGEVRTRGNTSLATRRRLAQKAFAITARYDKAIQTYLADDGRPMTDDPVWAGRDGGRRLVVNLESPVRLRYGENPHQSAELFSYHAGAGPLGGAVLQGKELSYNNLLDLDAAWRAVVAYAAPSIVIVKHLSPCGIASAGELAPALVAALASDPVSAYGGVIAANRNVDVATVTAMGDLFVECMIAPGFNGDARTLLAKRKNCRLLQMPDLQIEPEHDVRSITRGVLRQTMDKGDPEGTTWKVVSARQPSDEEMRALRFAWVACQHVKSNAIVFARGTATVGIGGGQPNRVDCVRIAAERAGAKARGAVMASDAFFPFADSIEVAAQAGITAVVHPGGSMRDAESIAAADKAGIALVVTGVRHFRH